MARKMPRLRCLVRQALGARGARGPGQDAPSKGAGLREEVEQPPALRVRQRLAGGEVDKEEVAQPARRAQGLTPARAAGCGHPAVPAHLQLPARGPAPLGARAGAGLGSRRGCEARGDRKLKRAN